MSAVEIVIKMAFSAFIGIGSLVLFIVATVVTCMGLDFIRRIWL